MKISVIVPIFGVEQYIQRCVESLMSQTQADVEYIFVNDATKDNSMEILYSVIGRYPEKAHSIKVLNHNENRGLPAARNTGLREASGDYIYHCDSDDYLEADMLKILYENAINTGADVVWCDYYETFTEHERIVTQEEYKTGQEALVASLEYKIVYNVWNKLVKRSLYAKHNIVFLDGSSYGEDMTMLMILANAQTCSYVSKPLYHYVRYNVSSLTKTLSDKNIDALRKNISRVYKYINTRYNKALSGHLAGFIIKSKWPFLLSPSYDFYEVWTNWFPEVNDYIWKYQNEQTNFRIRLIEWCASKKLYFIVWMHYYIVVRFLYSMRDAITVKNK